MLFPSHSRASLFLLVGTPNVWSLKARLRGEVVGSGVRVRETRYWLFQGTELMKPRKLSRSQNWKDVCGQCGEEDGVDPRLVRQSSGSRHRGQDRKTGQLCQQVAHVLEAVLTGEAHDDDLRNLSVVSVEPAPHTGRLLVTVEPWGQDAPPTFEVLSEKLRRATPWLRSELAASISRRKTPDLVFQVVWSNSSTLSNEEVDHA